MADAQGDYFAGDLADQGDDAAYEEMNEEYAHDDEGGAGGAEQTAEELALMKKKLKEMEEEANRLHAMQANNSSEVPTGPLATAAAAAAASASLDLAAKEEVDSRSIHVGNVDYSCTPEELQLHFQACGTVNRVTILTDKFGSPKGYAYLEFLEVDAVQNALLLDNTELRARQIKVAAKRTNVPGLKARGRGGRGSYGGRGAYGPPPPYYGGRGGYGAPRGGYGGYGGYPPRGRGRGGRFYAPY